eukprot:g6453.t1
MAKEIAMVAATTGVNTVIDVGCGQGHLGKILARKYNCRVIGIECSGHNAQVAQKSASLLLNRSKGIGRTGKAWHTAVAFHKNRLLQRVLSSWSGKENRSEAINIRDGAKANGSETINVRDNKKEAIQYTTKESRKGSFRSVCVWLDDSYSAKENLRTVLELGGLLPDSRVILVGLHACGDLSSTLLRLYKEGGSQCAGLVSVGCCYHRLTEDEKLSLQKNDKSHRIYHIRERRNFFKVAGDLTGTTSHVEIQMEKEKRKKRFGFPLCAFTKNVFIGKEVRDLACHHNVQVKDISMEFILSQPVRQSTYYRALLQQMLKENYPDLFRDSLHGIKAFKWRKRFEQISFEEYAYESLRKRSLRPELLAHVKKIATDLRRKAEAKQTRKRLAIFSALRMAFAPSIEAIIVLDRLNYLKEGEKVECNDHARAVALFDPTISPRNVALICEKE